jgi:hypothetical protein
VEWEILTVLATKCRSWLILVGIDGGECNIDRKKQCHQIENNLCAEMDDFEAVQ